MNQKTLFVSLVVLSVIVIGFSATTSAQSGDCLTGVDVFTDGSVPAITCDDTVLINGNETIQTPALTEDLASIVLLDNQTESSVDFNYTTRFTGEDTSNLNRGIGFNFDKQSHEYWGVFLEETRPQSLTIRTHPGRNRLRVSYDLPEGNASDIYQMEVIVSNNGNDIFVNVTNFDKGWSFEQTWSMPSGYDGGYYGFAKQSMGTEGQTIWVDSGTVRTIETSTLSGQVTNRRGVGLNNATVTLSSNSSVVNSDTTGSNGVYSVSAQDSEYNVSVEKPGYRNVTDTVNLSQNIEKNYVLADKSQLFQFIAPHWMQHGSTTTYRGKYSGGTYYEDVTGNISVTSQNTSIVTVDESNNTLIATDDQGVNNQTTLLVNYTRGNDSYSVTHSITVANRTIDNIKVMPSGQWIPTALGFGEDGTAFGIGSEIQYVLLVVFIGAGASWFARNEWVGIGVIEALMVLLWVLGHVGLGITMVSTFYALFAGYQLNKIPSRSDTNVQPGAVDQAEQPPNE